MIAFVFSDNTNAFIVKNPGHKVEHLMANRGEIVAVLNVDNPPRGMGISKHGARNISVDRLINFEVRLEVVFDFLVRAVDDEQWLRFEHGLDNLKDLHGILMFLINASITA